MSEVVFSPVESDRPGYFHIPGYSESLISKTGIVIDAKSADIVKQHRSSDYVSVFIYSDKLERKTDITIHRLLALAFLGEPTQEQRIVNHKDGIKSNNTADNIEWATHSWNIDHAYRHDLRDDNRPVLVKDIRTGSVVRYHALTESARFIGASAAAVCKYLKRRSKKPIKSFFQVKYEDDPTPWPDVNFDDNGFSKDACALHIESKKIIIAESIGALSKLLGIGPSTISWAIRTNRQIPVKGYLFKLMEDSSPWCINGQHYQSRRLCPN